MILLPLLFFLVLTAYFWKKHEGLDVCVYMSSLYAFTSFLAFIIIVSDQTMGTDGGDSGGMLWAGWNPELGIIPTLLYCLLIGLCILPFGLVHTKDIKNIGNNSPLSLWIFEILLILAALINLYCVADSTLEILSGDLETVRLSSNLGEQTPADIKAESLPFAVRLIMYLNYTTTLALPLMFYHLCFNHRAWWWNVLLFFTSLTPIFAGIQRADRTEPVFFALMFIYCLVFFRHAFTKKIKLVLGGVIAGLALLGSVYIVAVSMARFEDRSNGGAATSALQYGGQSYLNFCYFYEHASFSTICSERELPLFNHYVMHIDSNNLRRGERSSREGFFISVFASFVGDIMLDLTPLGLFVWIFMYLLLSLLLVKYQHRTSYDISEILAIFVIAAIPIFGIFYYRYHAWTSSFNFVCIVILLVLSRYKFKLSTKKQASKENEDIHDNSNLQSDEVDRPVSILPS